MIFSVIRSFTLFIFCVSLMQAQIAIDNLVKEIPDMEAPEDRLVDNDNIYRAEVKARDTIVNALRELSEKYDFDVYLSVNSGLVGTTVEKLAKHRRQHWIGNKSDGIVIVMDTNACPWTGKLKLKFLQSGDKRDSWVEIAKSQGMYSGAYTDIGLYPRIEEYELIEIMRQAEKSAFDSFVENKDLATNDRMALSIAAWVTTMSDSLAENFDSKKNTNRVASGIKLMGWMSLILLGLFLLGVLLVRVFSKAELRAKRTYRFPDVLVGERLGASFGGGKVSSVSYRSPPDGR